MTTWANGCVAYGVAATTNGIRYMEAKCIVGFKSGMRQWLAKVAAESQVEVPRITGHLARSMRWGVSDGHPVTGFIRYQAPYAGIVHEVPRPASSNGKWKYLEDPMKRNAMSMVPMIGAAIRKELGK